MSVREIIVCQTKDGLARASAQFVLGEIERKESGKFLLALSGGTTPSCLYDAIADTPHAGELISSICELFFSDERPVGPDHPDSNYKLASTHLFEPLKLDQSIIHRIRGESADLAAEAARYGALIYQMAVPSESAVPRLDLTILGVGPDGHTASLFPGYDFATEKELVVVPYVQVKKSFRVSFSLRLINASRVALILVVGDKKAEVVKKVLDKSILDTELPAARVAAERTVWILDKPAASLLNWTGPVLTL